MVRENNVLRSIIKKSLSGLSVAFPSLCLKGQQRACSSCRAVGRLLGSVTW